MPVKVVHKPVKGNKDWAIVEKSKVKGRSTSKEKAESSARARNASRQGWKPTGKKR